jgi:hypothetical protein
MQVMCELKQLAAAEQSSQHGRPNHLQQQQQVKPH